MTAGRIDSGHVYNLEHPAGEPCAVVDLLIESFGEPDGATLLWNATCFPFDDVQAWEHAKALVRKDCR